MSWKLKFEAWISIGKTKDWLLTRLNFLNTNYPNQFETGEYQEIQSMIETL